MSERDTRESVEIGWRYDVTDRLLDAYLIGRITLQKK